MNIILTESQLKKINNILEQVVQGKEGDPYEYKKEGNIYFARKKGSNKWIQTSGKISQAIQNKIFPVGAIPTKVSSSKKYCQPHPVTTDVPQNLEPSYQSEAGKLISIGIPTRTACEISFIKIRPKFSGKSFFVIDTLQNLIYLFDSNGKFVAKSQTLDGNDDQSQDTKKIAQALWTWQEQVEKMGFKWDPSKEKYLDKTGKNRNYNTQDVYNQIDKNNTRFFPKGIYSISGLRTDKEYAGGENNLFKLQTLDGKQIAQAIHGFYDEPPRVAALEQLKKVMGTKATSPKVPQEFIDLVSKYSNTSQFNKSYGCINVPVDFLKIARPYAKKGTMVFVIGETKNNYLVQNSEEFFDKLGNGESCVNPETLGQQIPKIEAFA